MTNDERTPEEIEREIESERAGLTSTLDSLQDRFSVESMARQVTDQLQKHGGDIGQSVSEAVKRNPIALALTGIGLAWLMLGDKSATPGGRTDYPARGQGHSGPGDRQDDYADRSGSSQWRGRTRSYSASDLSGRPMRNDEAGGRSVPSWARTSDGSSGSDGVGAKVKGAVGGAADSVSGAASSAAGSAQNAAGNVADTARGVGQSVSDTAHDLASTVSERASSLRDRLHEGTESLSDDARQRVVAARERAMDARDAAMDYGRQGRDRAVDLFQEQPLIAGALAAAFGAAIGAALPRSDMEDDYFGEQSDHLFDEADRIFEDEKAKLAKVAKAATDEMKAVANDVKDDAKDAVGDQSITDAVADKVKASGQRVVGAAKSEADKQNLGDVKKS